jgi:class 3 adenylate cyclase
VPPTISGAAGRKLVTVVFADLAGSTALEARMDPESVRTVMQRYYALVREVIDAHGGRLVKFIGDGAMAVFGVPENREDDALRALEAALILQEAFASLAGEVERDRGMVISLRVGVNTGEVVVGVDDDDVVGDAVHVAARLERAALPGAVLVGEATWRLTRREAVFEDVQELHLAGKAEKVRARTLVGVQPDGSEVGAEFVGRGRELEALQSEFGAVVRTGSPRLVTVVGSPGVGKTRLGAELERMVTSDAKALVAACTRETAVPLAPIAEALQSVLSDDERSATGRLAGLFDEHDSDQEHAENSFASVMLGVARGTDDGRLEGISVYDLDDQDRAMAELDRRYIEGEGAPYAEILTLFAEGNRALNQRDWDHFQACFSPAAVHVDHYSAGWDSRRGGTDILAAFIDFAGSLPGSRTIVRNIHACTADALLATAVVSGRSRDGGAVEFVFHTVCHRAGLLIDHTESFSSDALDDALAAYRRLIVNDGPRE